MKIAERKDFVTYESFFLNQIKEELKKVNKEIKTLDFNSSEKKILGILFDLKEIGHSASYLRTLYFRKYG